MLFRKNNALVRFRWRALLDAYLFCFRKRWSEYLFLGSNATPLASVLEREIDVASPMSGYVNGVFKLSLVRLPNLSSVKLDLSRSVSRTRSLPSLITTPHVLQIISQLSESKIILVFLHSEQDSNNDVLSALATRIDCSIRTRWMNIIKDRRWQVPVQTSRVCPRP
jgi:hypothetical protein